MKDLLPGDLDLVELSNKELEDYEIPEVISAKDIKEKEHANRLFAQETDDYSAKGIESGNWKQKPLLLRRRIMRGEDESIFNTSAGACRV